MHSCTWQRDPSQDCIKVHRPAWRKAVPSFRLHGSRPTPTFVLHVYFSFLLGARRWRTCGPGCPCTSGGAQFVSTLATNHILRLTDTWLHSTGNWRMGTSPICGTFYFTDEPGATASYTFSGMWKNSKWDQRSHSENSL